MSDKNGRVTRLPRPALLLAASTTLALIAGPAPAATAVCSGPIEIAAQHTPGTVVAKIGGALITVCNLDTVQFRVTPAACRHYAALALAGMLSGKTAIIFVDNAPTELCTQIPNWHVSDTRYFALQ